MKILIVEDEPPIARDIKHICSEILANQSPSVSIRNTLADAKEIINKQDFDLCFLDLNLNGENGFTLLEDITAESFHTVIVSAYTDRAIEAFEYGVFDFISKPFDIERFTKTFKRYFSKTEKTQSETKYLSYRKKDETRILNVEKVQFFKAADTYVIAELKNQTSILLSKTMDKLEQILPPISLEFIVPTLLI